MRTKPRTLGSLKIIVALVFVAGLLSAGYWPRSPHALAAVAPTEKKESRAAQLERGRTLYVQNCARCHGADGRSQTDMGTLYGATDLADARWWKDERVNDKRLTSVIANGKKGGMPAFGKRLAKNDIAAIVAFVRTLKQ